MMDDKDVEYELHVIPDMNEAVDLLYVYDEDL
jgi:hypothetical protein